MITLSVYNKIVSTKPKRIRLDNIDVNNDISVIRKATSEQLETAETSIELLYGGNVLKDGELLSTYNIVPGVTLHAIPKKEPYKIQEPEPVSATAAQQVVTALQAAILNPAYRHTVENLLYDEEALDNIVSATPGLAADHVAIAILQDPDLLAMLADPKLINSVLKEHPSLCTAATCVAAAVNEEAAKGGGCENPRAAHGNYYSMDQMSDDEEYEGPHRPFQMAPNQPITANQLGAALAALTGGGTSGESSRGATASSNPGTSGSLMGGITSDFFRQAIAATGNTSSASGTTAPQRRPITEEDLQQLREMGITDESVARRALEASGGDIQAALELIFGDGLQ